MKQKEERQRARTLENNFRQAFVEKFNELTSEYAGSLSSESFVSAFVRAGLNNQPQIQNQRVKGISSLPIDYSKEDIGNFLRSPYEHETPLRQTSEILRWTNYPYAKIIKTYADIPTDRVFFKPKYLTDEGAKTKEFEREAILIDKLTKAINPQSTLHRLRGKAMLQGKVVCAVRYDVDKSHNKVNYAFVNELPIDYCYIIGRNNVSGWTVSFDMMYFLKAGTNIYQYGDLFEPYVDAFSRMFVDGDVINRRKSDYVYASRGTSVKIKRGKDSKKDVQFYPENIDPESYGNPKVFMQNGRWAYYVSLPIDKVWVYEIDDTTPAMLPPLSGMMLTYNQQSDFEEIQKALYTNPLIKIFTGEIPYFTDDGNRVDDGYRLSEGARLMFEMFFDNLMQKNNTSGTAFYTAPVQNIKSHDFAESANANEISTTFNNYAGTKAGLASLIPVDKDIKAAQVEVAKRLESRYSTACIYPQFERMMNTIVSSLRLKYEWDFKAFGTIFNEDTIRSDAEKSLARGDTSALFTLSALDGVSWVDKLSMLRTINATGIMDLFRIPETAYTQSSKAKSVTTDTDPVSGGRPHSEGITSEAKEKAIDTGNTTED